MKELLEFIISEITGSKDFSVDQSADSDSGRVLLTIKANKDIVGLIIGKGGKTIKNIRKILAIKAVMLGQSVSVSITD